MAGPRFVRSRRSRLFSSALVVVVVGIAGCGGGDGFDFAPVSGVIRVDGQPAAFARIEFQPRGKDIMNPGPKSIGYADADGRYTVASVRDEGRSGAVAGPHDVTIFGVESKQMIEAWADPPDPSTLPPDYVPDTVEKREVPTVKVPREGMPLSYELPSGGTDSADFDL